MDTAEIVIREMQSNSGFQVFLPLLRERIREPGQFLRICILIVRFCRSMCDVQMRSKSGIPALGTTPTPTTSAGDYRCSPSLEAA